LANLKDHFIEANTVRLNDEKATKDILAANTAVTNGANDKSPDTTTPPPADHSYCHTHGYCVNTTHTSITCFSPATGHHTDTTITQQKGGSTAIWGGSKPKKRVPKYDAEKKKKAAKAAAEKQTAFMAEAIKAAMAAIRAEQM